MSVKNKVQLITYPDSMGGNLKSLHKILTRYFPDVFAGGIHILPPFPSSGDRGFAPLTYLEITPEFGTWNDIVDLSKEYDLLLDLMVNHISKESIYFQDFLKNGRKSQFADLFLTLDKLWKNGQPNQDDIDKMFLRREVPFSTFTIENSDNQEQVWTTFGRQTPSEQIDLDINSKLTKELLTTFMLNFKSKNIKIVRLDAVGYVIKKMGSTCFFVEPEIDNFLEWIKDLANKLEIELLPEVHSHYSIQYKLTEKGFWIYDFVLPYVVLETLINKDANKLYSYLKERPKKQFTMLDCHDGVPIKPDLDELVPTDDAKKIVDICLERGANLSKIYSDKHKSTDGFDVHQIRCSYFSALNEDENAYLAARAIQFFVPGIPQVYYVGLLAGANDVENVIKTGEGREINRHNYNESEIQQSVESEVVKRLVKLIKFRNNYPAFDGDFHFDNSDNTLVKLTWRKENNYCSLLINLNTFNSQIELIDKNGVNQIYII